MDAAVHLMFYETYQYIYVFVQACNITKLWIGNLYGDDPTCVGMDDPKLPPGHWCGNSEGAIRVELTISNLQVNELLRSFLVLIIQGRIQPPEGQVPIFRQTHELFS